MSTGCAISVCVATLVVLGLLGWGGFLLVRSFLQYEPPIRYDAAKTQEVTAPARPCYEMTIPDLPESKKLNVKAQLEHQVLDEVVESTCDTNVKVDCSGTCTAEYGDEKVVFDLSTTSCMDLGRIRNCSYRIKPRNRLLSQRHLHAEFWRYAERAREERHVMRCDTIPGGADLLPPASDGPVSSTRTKYRCYTRKPGRSTYTYTITVGKGHNLIFEEDPDR
ncbi:hypothetical protein DPM19_18065 [Actinomadura craniellae]|uniref:Uncharacterized protein n=1 Tax=Actinomadura craniellae TaxID=2231787 RepID=A0A365H399_9ACTN|nr:hypothetical protein [Actinomadura craniellae]RAY13585.1 hypothetical protein DPM19_18065 [Actinomadura craniellae]